MDFRYIEVKHLIIMAKKKHPSKPKKHGQPWTKAEDQKLKKDAKNNVPVTKMKKDYERTETAIRARASKLKASLGKPN